MKDYDDDLEVPENPTFSLRGVRFTAKPIMPGDAFDDLSEIQTGHAPPRLYEAFSSVIRRSLIPADRERWDELVNNHDVDVPIRVKKLAEIADDLVEATTLRPPERPSPSGSTPATTPTKSTGDSATPAAAATTP